MSYNPLMIINNLVFNKFNLDIDRKEKMVLLSLLNHRNWTTGLCNPSIETMRKEWLYASDREILEALRGLQEKELITKSTVKRRNYYEINFDKFEIVTLQKEGNPQNVGNLQKISDNTLQNVSNSTLQNVGTNKERTKKEQLYIEKEINEIRKLYDSQIIKEALELIENKDIKPKELLEKVRENIRILENKEAKIIELSQKKSNRSIKIKDLRGIDESIDKVEISEEEYKKLTDKYPKELLNDQILNLDNYISNGKGTKYKNHYKVLNIWCSKLAKEYKKDVFDSDMYIEG